MRLHRARRPFRCYGAGASFWDAEGGACSFFDWLLNNQSLSPLYGFETTYCEEKKQRYRWKVSREIDWSVDQWIKPILRLGNTKKSVKDMKNAIWATYDHKRSTEENPHHERCPAGSTSWCAWRKAEAAGTLDAYTHKKPPLNDAVLDVIRPVYEDLTSDNLLQRCLGCFTQNNNESLNALIWLFAPKHLYSGKDIVEIATFLATCIFNGGYTRILQRISMMGLKIRYNAITYANARDNERIERSGKRTSLESIEARTARRNEKAAQHVSFEAEDGILYGPGIAD